MEIEKPIQHYHIIKPSTDHPLLNFLIGEHRSHLHHLERISEEKDNTSNSDEYEIIETNETKGLFNSDQLPPIPSSHHLMTKETTIEKKTPEERLIKKDKKIPRLTIVLKNLNTQLEEISLHQRELEHQLSSDSLPIQSQSISLTNPVIIGKRSNTINTDIQKSNKFPTQEIKEEKTIQSKQNETLDNNNEKNELC